MLFDASMNLFRIIVPTTAAITLVAGGAHGQNACPQPAENQAAYALCQLDVPPRPQLDRATLDEARFPICPSTLMRVVVDQRGRVRDAEPLDTPTGENPPCESVAREWTFSPGFRHGAAVSSSLVVRFRYVEPVGKDSIWDPLISWSTRADTLTMSIEWKAPLANAFRPLAPITRDSAIAAVMREVAGQGYRSNINHLCLDLAGREHRFDSVAALMGTTVVAVFPRAECPSIRHEEDGSVTYVPNPPYLHVGVRGAVRPASPDAVVIDTWYSRGMSGAGYLCRATRATPVWSVRCVEVWSS